MVGSNHTSPSLFTLLGRIGHLTLRNLQSRIELMAVEWQEERLRLAQLVVRIIALVVLGALGLLLLTAGIIFVFPAEARIYVTFGLGILYLVGATIAGLGLRAGLHREPFSESIGQVKSDRQWLESLK